MKRESVNKFDLEAAFKALDEVEVPVVKGIRSTRENLQEKFTKKLVTEVLVEDYFDVGDTEELEQAQDERDAEIAKAKLARIEKIVDLEAETEEDLLPSYVGKLIVQCPQCMTLFYKKEEDIEKSEENPEVVNLNEPCQHCGNNSGYTLIGKVGAVGEDEAAQYDTEDFENELNLDFEDETAEAEDVEEPAEEAEEVATEGEEVDLAPVEDEESDEEEVKESLTEAKNNKQRLTVVEPGYQYKDADGSIYTLYGDECEEDDTGITYSWDYVDDVDGDIYIYISESLNEATIYMTKAEMAKLDKEVEEAQKEVAKYNIPMKAQKNSAGQTENVPDFEAVPESQREAAKKAHDRYQKALKARPSRSQNIIKYTDEMDESLTEDVDLNKQLDLYNDFIKYLQKMVEQDEKALEEAKKLGNKEVIAAIEKRLENSRAELKAALPTTVKDEVATDDLPTPEEADMVNAAENKEDKKEKKESLTEDVEVERKLAAEEASLEKADVEDYIVEAAGSDVVKALDALEAELMESAELTEAKYDVSDADFRAMLKNPVFNEACKKDLVEDLPPVNDAAFEKAIDAIEAAGSELTPEEQKLEDEELANKTPVEEKLEEDASVGVLPAPVNPLSGVASLLKRKLSSTEVIAKELAAHPLFKGLSVRTIQRTLLPYYIENMGKDSLTTEAVIDFFEYEGFAIYVLGNLDSIEEAAGKELLKADAKFIEALEEYAKKYDMIPESEKDFEAGETRFDYLYDIIIDSAPKGDGLKETLAELINIYNNLPDIYTEAVESETNAEEVESEADIWEVVEDLDETEFNKLTEQYLTKVYSNVQSFETTGCSLQDNKLIVEGAIKFVSGKTKHTTFIYEAKKSADKIILEGLNADFASTKAFVLNCKLDTANCLIVESLSYNYMINNTLVEGLLK